MVTVDRFTKLTILPLHSFIEKAKSIWSWAFSWVNRQRFISFVETKVNILCKLTHKCNSWIKPYVNVDSSDNSFPFQNIKSICVIIKVHSVGSYQFRCLRFSLTNLLQHSSQRPIYAYTSFFKLTILKVMVSVWLLSTRK